MKDPAERLRRGEVSPISTADPVYLAINLGDSG